MKVANIFWLENLIGKIEWQSKYFLGWEFKKFKGAEVDSQAQKIIEFVNLSYCSRKVKSFSLDSFSQFPTLGAAYLGQKS